MQIILAVVYALVAAWHCVEEPFGSRSLRKVALGPSKPWWLSPQRFGFLGLVGVSI